MNFSNVYLGVLVPTNTTCFEGLSNLLSAYLFSMETQQTIGFGVRSINDYCPDAAVQLIIHVIFGTILSAIFSGLFLAKFSQTGNVDAIRFSRKAVITQRNGFFYFVFREE